MRGPLNPYQAISRLIRQAGDGFRSLREWLREYAVISPLKIKGRYEKVLGKEGQGKELGMMSPEFPAIAKTIFSVLSPYFLPPFHRPFSPRNSPVVTDAKEYKTTPGIGKGDHVLVNTGSEALLELNSKPFTFLDKNMNFFRL